MKIGPLDSKPVTAPAQNDRKAGSAAGDKGDAKAEASAKVDISAAGSLMAQRQRRRRPSTPPRSTALRSAIRDGKFQIDADKIAGKLIANAQDLLKRYSKNPAPY